MKVRDWFYMYDKDKDIEFEEEVVVEFDYSPGENNVITSASERPNDPEEIDFCEVLPVGKVKWSIGLRNAIEEHYSKEDVLWKLYAEAME